MLKGTALKKLPLKSSVLKDWPELERPREKLVHLGSASLSDAELLAIFLINEPYFLYHNPLSKKL